MKPNNQEIEKKLKSPFNFNSGSKSLKLQCISSTTPWKEEQNSKTKNFQSFVENNFEKSFKAEKENKMENFKPVSKDFITKLESNSKIGFKSQILSFQRIL
jgi:hypothetical protein